MFSPEDRIILKNYCQKIIDNPKPIDHQEHERKDGFLWCLDWKIIEVLKCCFNGKEMYIADPPPNRLKNNPLFSKGLIVEEVARLKKNLESASAIVNYLKEQREIPYEPKSHS